MTVQLNINAVQFNASLLAFIATSLFASGSDGAKLEMQKFLYAGSRFHSQLHFQSEVHTKICSGKEAYSKYARSDCESSVVTLSVESQSSAKTMPMNWHCTVQVQRLKY